MFQGSRSVCVSQDDLSSADSDVSEEEEPAAKRPKSDEAGQSTENELILGQLEKDFDLAEHKGAAINTNLAAIVSKLLKEKTEEDKLTEIKKRYPAPKNCESLAETRVNLPIWNSLSEKAHLADIKLQKILCKRKYSSSISCKQLDHCSGNALKKRHCKQPHGWSAFVSEC